jgi:formylglycine-generating enzyme required for sulfatase activity
MDIHKEDVGSTHLTLAHRSMLYYCFCQCGCSFTHPTRAFERLGVSIETLVHERRPQQSVSHGAKVMQSKAIIFFASCALGLLHDSNVSAESIKADPGTLPPLAIFQDCAACPEMIVMPPGSFMMGAILGESQNPFDFSGDNPTFERRGEGEINIITFEHPRHRVEMDIPYAMARNEITHAEWMACVADGGCTYVPDHRVRTLNEWVPLGPNHPVINVSYIDVQQYVGWLNRQVGTQVYRLPTEAEWEYAARAGTETPFAQGDALTPEQANFSRTGTEQQFDRPLPELVNRDQPVEVDDLDAANAWGLRHMSGNVEERTLSCWTEQHLGLSSASAYLASAATQTPCRRTVKGGSFGSGMDWCRLAARKRQADGRRDENIGFRLVRELR